MDGQLSFASLDFAGKKKRTKRDVFLAEMAAVVPWSILESLIEPAYPKVGPQGGRRPFPIAVMLRIYCDAQTALALIHGWFDDYNTTHPHSRLGYRSPREHIAAQAQPAACPV